MVMVQQSHRKVLVCINRTCRKQGAEKVLQAFQQMPIENAIAEGTGCLGQCGNGPMVLVEPEQVWYCQVRPEEVPAVVERHLKGNQPIKGMLYRKFHPKE